MPLKTKIRLVEEPQGETYLALIRFAARRCQRFSLVWRDQFKFMTSARAIITVLQPNLVASTHTDTWPGTQLIGHKATVRHYSLNRRSVQVLQAVPGLYSWLQPGLPEDIAFYSSDEVLWLGTISHEREGWFEDGTLSRAEITEHVPGIVLSP